MSAAYTCIDDILDEVLVQLPGATTKAATLAAKSTLREFYTDSAAWQVDLQPVEIKPGKETYYLDPPYANSDILYIHSVVTPVTEGYRPLAPLTDIMSKLQNSKTRADLPMWYQGYVDVPGKISVYPILNDGQETLIIPRVSLKYRDPWDGKIPQFVIRYHRDIIIDGIIGKMMSQQDKPYTNGQQATYYLRRFRSGIARARDMAARQYTEAEHPTPFPSFAGKSQNRYRP